MLLVGYTYPDANTNTRKITGYDKAYFINDAGEVFDASGKLPVHAFDNKYLYVIMLLNGEEVNRLVHIMVAQAFIPNPLKKKLVNHKDRNRANPHLSNLEWCTHEENCDHQLRARGIRK